jgi:hypothetical protein
MAVIRGSKNSESISGESTNDIIMAGAGNDRIFDAGTSNDLIFGEDGNDYIFAGGGNDTLVGGNGNDTLEGGSGNDRYVGVDGTSTSNLGRGEIDLFGAGAGSDTYVLGSSANVFYDDGNAATAGTNDYALIEFFNPFVHTIELHGAASDYVLGSSPISGVNGTGIFLDTNGNGVFNSTDELIAIVQQVNGQLNLNDSSFVYV